MISITNMNDYKYVIEQGDFNTFHELYNSYIDRLSDDATRLSEITGGELDSAQRYLSYIVITPMLSLEVLSVKYAITPP